MINLNLLTALEGGADGVAVHGMVVLVQRFANQIVRTIAKKFRHTKTETKHQQ